MLSQLAFDFWDKRNPQLRFVVHWPSGFEVFDSETKAVGFAKRREDAWIETVII